MAPQSQKIALAFRPKNVTKRLILVLPERTRNVVRARYGLDNDATRMTLEAIGERYDITRERVRQIENHAVQSIRKTDAYGKERAAFDELRAVLDALGALVAEEELLNGLAKDTAAQNHLHFLFAVGDRFKKGKEDAHMRHHWYIDEALARSVRAALVRVAQEIGEDDLVPESDMKRRFAAHLKDVHQDYLIDEIMARWLGLSKLLGKNPLGEWGRATSPNIRVKGMRDYAYLAIRRHGSPMHFTEVAGAIYTLFGKKAHVATCHNELIKDPRFVLVGRGLYALVEWGYAGGVVRDVIRDVLKKHGPLTKKEVIERVLKERYVKENTIAVNLDNPRYFKKGRDRKYAPIF